MRRPVAFVVALLTAVSVTACGSGGPTEVADTAGKQDAQLMGHIHGLGVDPADGVLYIAAHMGVFRAADGAEIVRVADRWQDTMAFTVTGPGRFLAGGHPDLTEGLPPQLGLIRSSDAAQTWQPVSRQGAADFHALDVSGARIVGYDSVAGALVTTTDQRRWQVVARGAYTDVAVDPTDPNRILATTPRGALVEYDARRPSTSVRRDAPPLVLVDWAEGRRVVGATSSGAVFVSNDGGTTWAPVASVAGTPVALDAVRGIWHVATATGVLSSTDGGRVWNRVV